MADECLALAMLAGARAIEQNPRKYFGTTFVHDVFGDKPKEISYHDAAKMLREEAEAALAVVEVVRCKDCKHWFRAKNVTSRGSCDTDALLRHEDFWCAAGERRVDDED
ncbi:MAG: hypothetical protein J6S60_00215 [Oscillospiraceae bacterium]|nr:hypothetical protein [Oscillospiraceae bacterium]